MTFIDDRHDEQSQS